MLTMQIRFAKDSDYQAWDEYVLNHTLGTIFHLTRWKRAIEESFGHQSYYLMAVEECTDGTGSCCVKGVLPCFRIKSRLFGDYLVSIPFAELGGPVADSSAVAELLLAKATELAGEQQVDYLELKNSTSFHGFPTKDLYFNFSREIYPESEENLLAIPRKSRAAVRKGIKEGLHAETGGHLLDAYYEIMARSYHNLGTPIFAKSFFRNFLRIFGGDAEVMVVFNPERKPIAGVLTFYFRDRVMPYFAGSLVEYRSLCPNDFMYWKLLERGCQRGFRVFDFGRSKADTGSFHFKKNWGFEPTPLAYQYGLIRATELPNLSPANPKYRKKIELWRKMPFALTKIIGPPLARFLG